MRDWNGMIRRGLKKPPKVILKRMVTEALGEIERLKAPARRAMTTDQLLRTLECDSVDSLWQRLASRPYPAHTGPVSPETYDACCPGDRERVMRMADDAAAHRVDMLGSGLANLGSDINWSRDFRRDYTWPEAYFKNIGLGGGPNFGDVKVPWELSRLQWLIPLGQAFMLTGEARHAQAARDILTHWITRNPFAATVNWTSTMEVSLRFITMTWLFHVFHDAPAWNDGPFRESLLKSLFLNADYLDIHLAPSEVNSGVFVISAGGLAHAGMFFGQGKRPRRWSEKGWTHCLKEITRQTGDDGVDFEGAASYHRLAMEFFLVPALYRVALNLPVADTYRERLCAMARYVAAYSAPDGLAPIQGDDGGTRAMPFGGQNINDHRFVIGVAAGAFSAPDLPALFSGPKAEVFWSRGPEFTLSLPREFTLPASSAYPVAGNYIMRAGPDHVFIDAGSVGLAGKGGHGHNDCLSFEAVLNGVRLVCDRGTLSYASDDERNAFRGTAAHGTPQVDGEEINRYPDPTWLFALKYDAVPEVTKWHTDGEHALFVGCHQGYQRLADPVTPERTLLLDYQRHALYLEDRFSGAAQHQVRDPLHLAPGVEVLETGPDWVRLEAGGKRFRLAWRGDYRFEVVAGRTSPAYGVEVVTRSLVWQRQDAPLAPLAVFIAPEDGFAAAKESLTTLLGRSGLASSL